MLPVPQNRHHWPFYLVVYGSATLLTILGLKILFHAINVKAERVLCFSDWISDASTLDNTPEEIVTGCQRRHPFLKFQ
jgi:hypothetical protein